MACQGRLLCLCCSYRLPLMHLLRPSLADIASTIHCYMHCLLSTVPYLKSYSDSDLSLICHIRLGGCHWTNALPTNRPSNLSLAACPQLWTCQRNKQPLRCSMFVAMHCSLACQIRLDCEYCQGCNFSNPRPTSRSLDPSVVPDFHPNLCWWVGADHT